MLLLAAFTIPAVWVLVLLWYYIYRRSLGQKRPFFSLLHQYLFQWYVSLLSLSQRRRLELSTKDVRQVQQSTLLHRLHKDRNTEYGKMYRFSEVTDRESFCNFHPLTQYGHYKDYIQRIGKGEENILISERPSALSVTSGTSGSTAILLSVKTAINDFHQAFGACYNARINTYPQTRNLQRTAKFFYPPVWRKSESDIPIGSGYVSTMASKHSLSLYSTPVAGYEITTAAEAQYIHLLFALKDHTLGILEASFASIIYHAFVFLQLRWEQLVEDIRVGRVNPELTVAEGVRLKLNAQLKPDPQRALKLAGEFVSGFKGIARRVWPHLNLVVAVDSGANNLYGDHLKRFYCEGVPIYSPIYAATEGLIGVNLWPEQQERHYLLCPLSMFYEFIPVNFSEDEQPQTLFMEEVKEDELYELVITNASGLYRYRIGDIVKVVAFHNQSPVVEFKYRQGQMLNVRGEKITEQAFYQTLLRAVKLWPGVVLLDYCCVESGLLGQFCGGSDPHYEVFVEIEGVRNLSEEQRYKLDQCLQEDSTVYQLFRRKGSIGPMRVHIVATGSFKELTDFIIANLGTSHNQFQIPRVLKNKQFLDFIQRKVIS
ncbi:GH3 domain-containing protein isoform X1 [Hypanus sabinus]|uniref:GH3 domain-containing protein isoform X1 n=1 Tax=Hypanus sabinus TaxID=79690 RepID=UPI0028C4F940|nr:GH3 domain-containing protein isoform X1 [Hypanus sabinus]XP_059812457.1 GH3 domain-containing protein isoform X1 [Hypanus sabinus]